jgi:hypothetical protein
VSNQVILRDVCIDNPVVSPKVYDNIIRYTAFASASYADDCIQPPYGSAVVDYFNDSGSDTQAALFRDDEAKELIISFRGTSTPKDLDVDLDFVLVDLTAAGTSCSGCKVPFSLPESSSSYLRKGSGPQWLPGGIQFTL